MNTIHECDKPSQPEHAETSKHHRLKGDLTLAAQLHNVGQLLSNVTFSPIRVSLQITAVCGNLS